MERQTLYTVSALMRAAYLYPFIIFAGVLQALGNVMNAQLKTSLVNPWLASIVSFVLIVFVFLVFFCVNPRPLPTMQSIEAMPWWAPLGGIAGAVAVFGGLLLVNKVGAGPFNGLLLTANLIASLAIDHFGVAGMPVHTINTGRFAGAILMAAGIALINIF